MNKVVRYLAIVILLYTASSCIKSDSLECPPQYTIKVSVKDKNYANIDKIPQLNKVDENLPFKSFCNNIYYTLQNLVTGQIVSESSLIEITDNNQSYAITFNDIPNGQYELSVWGNLLPNTPIGSLHANKQETSDIYMGSTNLTFSPAFQKAEMMLERTKGKLLVICNQFPSTITGIEENISSIYETINSHFEYGGSTTILKTFPLNNSLETILAPSVEGTNSTLNLEFFTDNGTSSTTSIIMPEVKMNIKKNEITAISVNYDDVINAWEIWTYIDGKWTLVHNLDIKNQ